MNEDTARALALFAALHAIWSDVHPVCDQIVQSSANAVGKSRPGIEGARHCACHVATYTAGQALVAAVVTRALGYRIPPAAFTAGMVLNAATHYVIDRRHPFVRFLRSRWVGKGGYLDHATVQRREGIVDGSGPGTALMEMDQAAHRLIGVFASALTAALAIRNHQK